MAKKIAAKSTAPRRRLVKPVTARGIRTRQRLMEAAIQIIGAKGIAAARVHEIADRAGCGYGTFYKYFGSKIDLVRQAMLEVYGEMTGSVLPPRPPASEAGSTAQERIRPTFTRYADVLVRLRPILEVLDRAAGVDPDLLSLHDALQHEGVETLAQRVIRLEGAGYRQVADPYLVALAISSLVDEMTRRWRLYGSQISKEDFIEMLISMSQLILHGQRAERAPSGPVRPLVMPDG
ncbi:MAG: TetR/AcrR family transcriptional regulator [Dehalococcoidia bacterium]|jgi:AcrR family transcriptional regulator